MKKYNWYKRFLSVVLVAVLCAGLYGCSDSGSDSGEEKEENISKNESEEGNEKIDNNTVAFVCIDMQGAFWVEMMKGAEVAAEDYGINIVFKSGEGSLEKQISLIENLVAQNVGCIIVDPLDKQGILPAVEMAADAGIPVVTCGNQIDGSKNVSAIYNDVYDMGKITDIVCKKIGEKGKVACVVGAPGSAVSDARQKGFEDSVAKYDKVESFVLPAKWDATIAQQMVTDLLVAEPDLNAVICADAVAFQVYQAVDAAGKAGDVLISSYTAMKENIPGVEEGTYLLDLLMGGGRVGYWNVATAAQMMDGEEIPQLIYLPTSIVMNQEEIDQCDEWGILDSISYCTPDEALDILEGYSDEFGPDGYNVENYQQKVAE